MNTDKVLLINEKKNEGPKAGEFESLKEAAENMIKKGSWVGLNPHKVKRLCIEYEQLRATELSETPVIDGEQATAPVGDELSAGTRQRIIQSLGRLVTEAKHREDDCRGNLDNGSKGGYSELLTKDIELLDELEEGTPAEHGDRHHDEDTRAAAYEQGFEDAKKIIRQEIQRLLK